jgi:CBS domain-containing protein
MPPSEPDGPSVLAALLAEHQPFAGLTERDRSAVVEAASTARFSAGAVILDAFATRSTDVFVVMSGFVLLWNDPVSHPDRPDERLGPGGVFGFSAMLTERSVGPRVVADTAVQVAMFPAEVVAPAFASATGARFLAAQLSSAVARPADDPIYRVVDDLLERAPLIVRPTATVARVAKAMTEQDIPYAALRMPGGRWAVVTDRILRRRVLAGPVRATSPVEQIADDHVPLTSLGRPAAEAWLALIERDAEFVLVLDADGEVCGVVTPRDFAVSPSMVGLALNDQVRRAESAAELGTRARGAPGLLRGLLVEGLVPGRVVAVYSSLVDGIVRRAVDLVFADHPDLSTDAFTWLALGSNGRREAVPSSDVDSAVVFADGVTAAEMNAYRGAFAEVDAVLARAGLSGDGHGATAAHKPFGRTAAQWRAATRKWLAAPEDEGGAIMASLLLDARPIHGTVDLAGLTGVTDAFRRHPGTMRLLLQATLSHRARLHSLRRLVPGGVDRFDIKEHGLLPVVNIGRWAALSVGSPVLSTVERLRAASGSSMLPAARAENLIEVFEVLQGIRLRYQLQQLERTESVSNVVNLERMSPLDRSLIARAVREITAIQRRMANVSRFVDPQDWTTPEKST